MTKKGRWWWVKANKYFNELEYKIYDKKKYADNGDSVDTLCGEEFERITGLKLKEGEVRKVRLEWEE